MRRRLCEFTSQIEAAFEPYHIYPTPHYPAFISVASRWNVRLSILPPSLRRNLLFPSPYRLAGTSRRGGSTWEWWPRDRVIIGSLYPYRRVLSPTEWLRTRGGACGHPRSLGPACICTALLPLHTNHRLHGEDFGCFVPLHERCRHWFHPSPITP